MVSIFQKSGASRILIATGVILCAAEISRGIEYFLDDAQVTVSGELSTAVSPFTVDQKWSFAPSTDWAPWDNLQPGREFLMAGAYADSLGGGPTNENTALNPVTIDLSLGNGTYSNVSFLVLSHGYHSTVPPVARVEVVAEGEDLGEVAEDFAASVDYQAGGSRYNWVTLPDSYEVTDGSLTLSFGRALSANATWYTIGRIQADFAVPPEELPGDHNDDEVVDILDYVVWRIGDPDGTNDPQGYADWAANYVGGSGTSFNAAVPEPASTGLLLLGVLLLTVRRTRFSA